MQLTDLQRWRQHGTNGGGGMVLVTQTMLLPSYWPARANQAEKSDAELPTTIGTCPLWTEPAWQEAEFR